MRNDELPTDEEMFYLRNCSTCEHMNPAQAVIDRMRGRGTKPPPCRLRGKAMTYEQRLKIIYGIGHTRQAGDCPGYKLLECP